MDCTVYTSNPGPSVSELFLDAARFTCYTLDGWSSSPLPPPTPCLYQTGRLGRCSFKFVQEWRMNAIVKQRVFVMIRTKVAVAAPVARYVMNKIETALDFNSNKS
uniref:Uncharacterized protein n=2 Tax=Cacopsylla melanoneura TaxID=428564 RepID=A0A8D8ZWY9_9HEMI